MYALKVKHNDILGNDKLVYNLYRDDNLLGYYYFDNDGYVGVKGSETKQAEDVFTIKEWLKVD